MKIINLRPAAVVTLSLYLIFPLTHQARAQTNINANMTSDLLRAPKSIAYLANPLDQALLSKIESLAEDTYDYALIADFAKTRGAAAQISRDWNTFRPRAKSAGASDNLVTSMDFAVASLVTMSRQARDKLLIARAANSVSRNMEGLFSLFSPAIPPSIMTLDYYGRELAIDGLQFDLVRAQVHLKELNSVWSLLRPNAISHVGGTDVARRFDESTDSMALAISHKNANELVRLANANLELTDAIENVYTRNY
jgi:hypothetical protein